MVTYKLLEEESQKKVAKTGKTDVSYDKIEHLKKVVSSHRAALDFDKAFVMEQVRSTDFNFKRDRVGC